MSEPGTAAQPVCLSVSEDEDRLLVTTGAVWRSRGSEAGGPGPSLIAGGPALGAFGLNASITS